jgi:hypothetical protein
MSAQSATFGTQASGAVSVGVAATARGDHTRQLVVTAHGDIDESQTTALEDV